MEILWKQRKRLWCRLPWTFTVYSLSSDRFFVSSGVFNKTEKELRLYRVLDISLTRSFIQRIFHLGSIHLDTTDRDQRDMEIKNIVKPREFKEMLTEMVEEERKRNRVTAREFMTDSDGLEDDALN